MEQPRAVLFDAYGTLFDVYSVALTAEQLFPGQGSALGILWRDKQIEYTRLVTGSGDGEHYRPFWDLTRAGLRYACKRLGLELSAAAEERLMNEYRHLSAFPEDREVLQALKAGGLTTGILSNGDPDMLGVAVRSAGLEDLLDHVLSVGHRAQIQDPSRRVRPRPCRHRPGSETDRVRQQQRLGRAGRDLVRLPHPVGQPLGPAVRGTRHPADPHRRQPARRAGFFRLTCLFPEREP